jgi:NAD(P)-dependent dehydrogenase (short-subunit alcohol dehydrogenase family)
MGASAFSLEGKVSIVTGGGTGIGKAIALEFARAGADVVVASRKPGNLEPVAAEIQRIGRRSLAVATDVRNDDQMRELIERTAQQLGRLDVMINNAGASFMAHLEDISLNGWNAVVGINLNGVYLGCKWAGKQMMRQGGGVIVNVASIAGIYGSVMMPHYAAAKAAVINLTRTLGSAWARHNIRVNCIAPGPVETQGYLENLSRTNPNADEIYRSVASRIAMGRWGKVEEIAHPCLFLASEASSFMTGSTIIVDGGAALRDGELF